jgi:hypothetical protein
MNTTIDDTNRTGTYSNLVDTNKVNKILTISCDLKALLTIHIIYLGGTYLTSYVTAKTKLNTRYLIIRFDNQTYSILLNDNDLYLLDKYFDTTLYESIKESMYNNYTVMLVINRGMKKIVDYSATYKLIDNGYN